MSRIPPMNKDQETPKRKPAARRKPPAKQQPFDTPSPATPPIPEPEPKSVPKRAANKPRAGSLENRLAEALAGVSLLPSLTGDQYSSYILATRSEKFAHDLAELAKVNPRVKKFLENLLDGGAYGGVMFSGAAMLLPILWSYGILPSPGFDPFAAFYPPVPAEFVPRSAQRERRSSGDSGGSPKPSGKAAPGGGATVKPTDPNGGVIPGVVTVKPGAHPKPPAASL